MSDLSETPAVAPEDAGGDERIGLRIAGALLAFLGLGVGVAGNLVLHATASTTGSPLLWWVITPTMGPYAWGTVALGVIAGFFGVAFLWLAQGEPKGPFRLPGTAY